MFYVTVAQQVERHIEGVGVSGSIPFGHTTCAHSSMAEHPAFNWLTRVRFSVGTPVCFLSSAGQSAALRKRRPMVRIRQEAPNAPVAQLDQSDGLLSRWPQVRVLPGAPFCRFSPMAEALVLGTSCSRFESGKRHQCHRLLTGIGNHTFNVDNASSILVGGTNFASVVQRTRTLVSEARGRQFDSGQKPHIPVAQQSVASVLYTGGRRCNSFPEYHAHMAQW